jgi:para-aminobenzoate synthetase component 1
MIRRMNRWGGQGLPFFFMISFELDAFYAIPLHEIDPGNLQYAVGKFRQEYARPDLDHKPILLTSSPIEFTDYHQRFQMVKEGLRQGNTFLLNLTCPTPIELNHSLPEVYHRSKALYKLCIGDHLLVFSPETFIKIHNGLIESHPMKGTIDATLPDAARALLDDPKEKAEHYTIVDLIRNDLSMVSRDVRVEQFRYITEIQTERGRLLQSSSRITGSLPGDYPGKIGDILMKMLPAGSVSGAPKPKTLEIIREAEGYRRGFYTGVMGITDGRTLDSGVMIRYIERTQQGLVFKSGGGITWDSDARKEYQEMIAKVYVPAL